MRLYTVEINEKKYPAALVDGEMKLLKDAGLNAKDMNELICDYGLTALKNLDFSKAAPVKDYKICAPITRPLQDVLCLGVNYAAHYEECIRTGTNVEHERTVYFAKRVNKFVAGGEGIPAHRDITKTLDYEVELAVIIGKDAYKVKREDALDYVFGYTILNDVSARNIQSAHKQWYFGKSLDGFTPIGPCIVTADEFGNPDGKHIECYVNGQLRQDSNTHLMIMDVPGFIEELTSGLTLAAGSVIASGTPSGVAMGMDPSPWLVPGDLVECRIEGIGSLKNTIID